MPFNPFVSVTGRHAFSLFDIRLENDFIVFRGSEHESSGQLLKGVVAVCVPSQTRIEDIHLRLIGTLRFCWTDVKSTPTGISTQKFDKSVEILNHRWPSFIGTPGKSMVLEKGNYEFPFELMLPGETCESVEGLRQASITYRLKATIARGKLAYDHHAYKHVRIIRTLEASALEFLHAMSVENIWPNKVEYSIVVPQKAIVFGSAVPLETRFTPLLKGLEIGDVTVKLVEICELVAQSTSGIPIREHKREREVTSWVVPMSREEHWNDMIEDTGQEGWVMNTHLDLPRKLGKCVQDVNVHGIKTRHKLKLVVALKNPDGHISELRATLPVSIFISPNIPLDEEGNLSRPTQPNGGSENVNRIAPPGYGEHVLDQLYEDLDTTGFQTPGLQSGMASPYFAQSRAGSSENLAAMINVDTGVAPAALSSRLQDMSVSPGGPLRRDTSLVSMASSPGAGPSHHRTPTWGEDMHSTPTNSAPLSRQHSGGDHPHSHPASGRHSPEHIDFLELPDLSKVPSYSTAIKSSRVTPLVDNDALPDYMTAMSAPTTPTIAGTPTSNPMDQIVESLHEDSATIRPPAAVAITSLPTSHPAASAAASSVPRTTNPGPSDTTSSTPSSPTFSRSRRPTLNAFLSAYGSHSGDVDEQRRLHLVQARNRVV